MFDPANRPKSRQNSNEGEPTEGRKRGASITDKLSLFDKVTNKPVGPTHSNFDHVGLTYILEIFISINSNILIILKVR